jgi:hypothetical protein
MTPFANTNVSFSAPPLQTPIIRTDQNQFGVAWQNRADAANAVATLGDITAPWVAWFNQVYLFRQAISGTRANRVTLQASTMPGRFYFETDTGLLYCAVACTAPITGATNATPVVYSTTFNTFINGNVVNVSGVLGNLGANASVTVASVSANGFTGTGSAGTAAYTSGGVAVGPVRWTYVAGTYKTTQSGISAFTANLTAADSNLLIDVTDYAHVLRWTGTALTYNDPADMPGRVESFLVDPNPTTGWQLCDGSAGVSKLNADGTLTGVTVPNIVGGSAAYIKLGTPASATINAATAPGFTSSGGTISPVSAGTPSGTVSAIAATGTAGVNVTSSGSTSVATESHTHAAPTFTGNALATHTHALSGLSGSVDATGQPSNIVLRPWLRL